MGNHSLTIDEIASLAGVSKTTVSRVLNGKPDVKKETADRILSLIRETGYVPNIYAKAINGKKPHTIGLVIPYSASYIFSSSYFSEMLRGISTNLDEHNYCLMLCYQNANFTDYYRQGRVDAFIVITPNLRQTDFIDELLDTRIPFSLTSSIPKYQDRIPFVDLDDEGAARTVVEYLLSLGHKDIAFIGEDCSAASGRRLSAFKSCLLNHGITLRSEYVCLGGDDLISFGYSFAWDLMNLPKPPTAIFCAADMIAIGANRALHKLNLRIPQQVSLVGFDDVFISQYLNPPLTTVHQSAFDRGYQVAEMLIQHLETGEPMQGKKLDYRLVVRDSTVPPPADCSAL